MHRGHWEAKDTDDDLEAEIKKKIAAGYPLGNIIFEDTRVGHLFQNGRQAMRADPKQLCDFLNAASSLRALSQTGVNANRLSTPSAP